MKVNDLDALAEKIRDEMFTTGDGHTAFRVALLDTNGRDLGGWGREPFARQVARILKRRESTAKTDMPSTRVKETNLR